MRVSCMCLLVDNYELLFLLGRRGIPHTLQMNLVNLFQQVRMPKKQLSMLCQKLVRTVTI